MLPHQNAIVWVRILFNWMCFRSLLWNASNPKFIFDFKQHFLFNCIQLIDCNPEILCTVALWNSCWNMSIRDSPEFHASYLGYSEPFNNNRRSEGGEITCTKNTSERNIVGICVRSVRKKVRILGVIWCRVSFTLLMGDRIVATDAMSVVA